MQDYKLSETFLRTPDPGQLHPTALPVYGSCPLGPKISYINLFDRFWPCLITLPVYGIEPHSFINFMCRHIIYFMICLYDMSETNFNPWTMQLKHFSLKDTWNLHNRVHAFISLAFIPTCNIYHDLPLDIHLCLACQDNHSTSELSEQILQGQ